jgi:hypothetical protein
MADELVDRVAILVAVCRFPSMGHADSRSLRFNNYVCMQRLIRRTTMFLSAFIGDVRREFMQRLSAALDGILGSYLRDALQKGSIDVVACLLVPRA